MLRDIVGDLFNGVTVLGFCVLVGLQFYPAPIVKADTTGIVPDTQIVNYKNVEPGDYVFATSIVEGVTQEEIQC